jgi:hypothetical protein
MRGSLGKKTQDRLLQHRQVEWLDHQRRSEPMGRVADRARLAPGDNDDWSRPVGATQRFEDGQPSANRHQDVDHHEIDRRRSAPRAILGAYGDEKPAAIRDDVGFDIDCAKGQSDGLSLVIIVLGDQHAMGPALHSRLPTGLSEGTPLACTGARRAPLVVASGASSYGFVPEVPSGGGVAEAEGLADGAPCKGVANCPANTGNG